MRVLVLEDNRMLSDALCSFLRREGLEAEPVYTLEEARAALRREQFDAVLADWLLAPDVTAAPLVDFVATLAPAPRIVLASATPDIARFAEQRGIPFLSKPFDIDTMLRVLRGDT